MDIISHGLWGGVAFGRKNKKDFWWSFFFGVSPDLFSFGIFTVSSIFERGGLGRPELASIPQYVHTLYDYTHSFVIFAAVFALVWILRKKPFWPMLGWPLHIVVDIFTHSSDFFPTPFLWPVSDYHFDGVSWGTPAIFFTNVALVVFAYLMWLIQRQRRKKAVRDEIRRRA